MKLAALTLAAALIATPAAAQVADWRTPDPENLWVIDTNQGRVLVELSPQLAPAHVERIRTLTRQGFYDGLTFFRVIDGFMAQTGDPENAGTGGSSLPDLEPEFSFRRSPGGFLKVATATADAEARGLTEVGFLGVMPVRSSPEMQMMVTADGKAPAWGLFCPGVAGMARAATPNSANSQFFLMRDHRAELNLQYTPFGRVVSGLDVVRRIKAGEPVAQPQDRMTKVRLAADLPAAERPKVQVMDTGGAAFKALVEETKAKRGAFFHVCDVEIPAKLG
ncbi:MAG TPA: peptidylprolyl isomerase [Caulobacteraceae bacterium]|nr:peptidylprolyl isomerase [Caulobacteraceae bacterium]